VVYNHCCRRSVGVNFLSVSLMKYGPVALRKRWPNWLCFLLALILAGPIMQLFLDEPQDRTLGFVLFALVATFLRIIFGMFQGVSEK
jgi:ABC-type transport system involved in cytochrome c biogenesis permease component